MLRSIKQSIEQTHVSAVFGRQRWTNQNDHCFDFEAVPTTKYTTEFLLRHELFYASHWDFCFKKGLGRKDILDYIEQTHPGT